AGPADYAGRPRAWGFWRQKGRGRQRKPSQCPRKLAWATERETRPGAPAGWRAPIISPAAVEEARSPGPLGVCVSTTRRGVPALLQSLWVFLFLPQAGGHEVSAGPGVFLGYDDASAPRVVGYHTGLADVSAFARAVLWPRGASLTMSACYGGNFGRAAHRRAEDSRPGQRSRQKDRGAGPERREAKRRAPAPVSGGLLWWPPGRSERGALVFRAPASAMRRAGRQAHCGHHAPASVMRLAYSPRNPAHCGRWGVCPGLAYTWRHARPAAPFPATWLGFFRLPLQTEAEACSPCKSKAASNFK
ncbi:unnamed protein product, partial [Amoebophrya sp. A120]